MNGQDLVNDYRTVMIGTATAGMAADEANRSENNVLHHLDAVSSGKFLQPNSINPDDQADITRTSVDAHFKKVQAAQLNDMNLTQIQALTEQDQAHYYGRRVQVNVLNNAPDVIEFFGYEPRRGHYSSPLKRRSVSGTIHEVIFEENILVIKPGLFARLLNSRLQNYIVYIINPHTAQPLVSLQIR